MLSFVHECIGGLYVNDRGYLVAPMFDLTSMPEQELAIEVTRCVSIACVGLSIMTTLYRPLRLKKSVDLIYWTGSFPRPCANTHFVRTVHSPGLAH